MKPRNPHRRLTVEQMTSLLERYPESERETVLRYRELRERLSDHIKHCLYRRSSK
jgi:hypothetical protein